MGVRSNGWGEGNFCYAVFLANCNKMGAAAEQRVRLPCSQQSYDYSAQACVTERTFAQPPGLFLQTAELVAATLA
jgi:hypothetical protein